MKSCPPLSTRPDVDDPAVSPERARWVIATAMLVILLGALDQTIVVVAVPTIARELGDVGWLAWVVSSYLVAATVVTPLYGRYGDRHGRAAVLVFGIALFLVASVGCALAQTMPQLVIARALQGAGGGALISCAQALIADVVPLRERGRYQGWIAAVWAGANIAGPVVGGVLTHHLSWPWVFWINLPLGALALAMIHRGLRGLPVPGRGGAADIPGALLLVAGLTALLLPITRIGQGSGWSEPANALPLLGAVLLLALFVRHERRCADPLVPLQLLALPTVALCSALLFLVFFVMIALTVLIPLRLQWVAGLSVADSALHLLALTLGIPAAASIAGRVMYRSGRIRPLQRVGVALVPAALVVLALLPAGRAWPVVTAESLALLLLGLGLGLQLPTGLVSSQNAVPREHIGTVTALTSLARLLGGAIGVAVLSSLLWVLLREQLPQVAEGGLELLVHTLQTRPDTVDPQALDRGFRIVLWVCAGVSLLAWPLAGSLPDSRLDATAATPAATRAATPLAD